MSSLVLIRGEGDLASGAALRLVRAGLPVVITELPQPLAVRRLVSFSQAVYSGEITIEGITAHLAEDASQARWILGSGSIAVRVDPEADCRHELQPLVLVDGRMTKRPPELGMDAAPLVIGWGPGFTAGYDCHAAIETRRGPRLGRVIWQGVAELDTGVPDATAGIQAQRVLRAPGAGRLRVLAEIGVLRGMLPDGFAVEAGMKIGDVDPRDDPALCRLVSDKALAVGGGVMEAVLSLPDIRARLWEKS
jgi:xanthine dehydrogenase accessory factor